MKSRALMKTIIALVFWVGLVPCTQGAEMIDDSVIAALDAEIAQAGDVMSDYETGGNGDVAKADELIKSIDEEIAGLDAQGEMGRGSGVGEGRSFPANGKLERTGRRPSKDSKGVIVSGLGSGKTKERAEEIACWNAVRSALCRYVGADLVNENIDAVKKRTMSVASDVISRHEVVEEGETDGKHTVKVKAWIGKKSLASKFSDIFPDAFSAGEVNQPSKVLADADRPATKGQSVVVVTVTGKGETREEAKKAAFRAAVEKAIGAWVDMESRMEKSELLKDTVNSISNGDIKRCEVLEERREPSGLHACKIKAWVEKKAIAPKFKTVFPAAFKDIGEAAETLHAHRVTSQGRAKDAAAFMTAELEGLDRMRNWVRLSVTKGKELAEVKETDRDEVANEPGKGLYSVRYSMTVDMDAYFKGFLPHFKEMLTKMQEGEAEEDVVLAVTAASGYPGDDHTYFVDPVMLSGFPGTATDGVRGRGGNPEFFMFDQYKGLSKVQNERTFNIWLLDRMNKDRTAVRCSAYKVPASAVMAYWKCLYGELDSSYAMKNPQNYKMRIHERVEVVLLDEEGDEIAAQVDNVPAMLLTSGFDFNERTVGRNRSTDMFARTMWEKSNVFNTFFVRPMFACDLELGHSAYSTEIQREVYFPLADSQLGRVKKVKVRFVGSGK